MKEGVEYHTFFFCPYTEAIIQESIDTLIKVVSYRPIRAFITVDVSARTDRCERAYRSK